MGKLPESNKPTPTPGASGSGIQSAKPGARAVVPQEYISLAGVLQGRDGVQRVHKKDVSGEALRSTAELYQNREYVAAYECLKPVYDKVVSDMQRILARNVEFEANKIARDRHTPLAIAKSNVLKMRAYAQQVMDQFDRLLQDLESKPLVRNHLKKGRVPGAPIASPAEESPPTMLASTSETQVDANIKPPKIASEVPQYEKIPYAPPQTGTVYCMRDKAGCERVIRIIGVSPDGALVQVETIQDRTPSTQPIQLAVESLARQAAKGWCNVLSPLADSNEVHADPQPEVSTSTTNARMRLDIQNFSRCCADIARANITYSLQPIKDVGDGPFRAGNYEKAFLQFEQLAVGFNSAVANSRRAITDGRRTLTAEKGKLSGKEIQDRSAAFVRSEQLIYAAEREFSTILEGLRMYFAVR